MLKWSIIFFVLSLIAGFFGFTGIAVAASGVAKVLFFLFAAGFIITLIFYIFIAAKIIK